MLTEELTHVLLMRQVELHILVHIRVECLVNHRGHLNLQVMNLLRELDWVTADLLLVHDGFKALLYIVIHALDDQVDCVGVLLVNLIHLVDVRMAPLSEEVDAVLVIV